MDLRDNPYKNELMFAGFNQDQGILNVILSILWLKF